jgi:hypothetical protein
VFKAGDRAICINNDKLEFILTIDKVYEIIKYYDRKYTVEYIEQCSGQ